LNERFWRRERPEEVGEKSFRRLSLTRRGERREDLDETSHKGYQIYEIEFLLKTNHTNVSWKGCSDWVYEKKGRESDRAKGDKLNGS
jgi:hypothetical protein